MVITKITSIEDLQSLTIEVAQYKNPIYRGQSNKEFKLESSAYRRLSSNGSNGSYMQRYLEYILEESKRNRYDVESNRTLHNLEMLAKLQHQGAATWLLDFSFNISVALWFACSEDMNSEKDGKLFILKNTNDSNIYNQITTMDELEKPIKDFFLGKFAERINIWESTYSSKRVMQQDSVFVFGSLESNLVHSQDMQIVTIDKNIKKDILNYIDKVFNINHQTIYKDFVGFASYHGVGSRVGFLNDPKELFDQALSYQQQNQYLQAISSYTEALSIYKDLAKTNPAVYNSNVAGTLNNLALLYRDENENKKALEHYTEALGIYRKLAKTNPAVYNSYLAMTLNNLAILYNAENRNDEALELYTEALGIRRDLARANPAVYNSDVATTLNSLAILYNAENINDKALELYKEALGIRRELARANPAVYNPDVAMTLNNLALLYSDENRNNEALELYKEALDIHRELARANPAVYNSYLAMTLNNLAILYSAENRNSEALEHYTEALGIYRKLAKANHAVYSIGCANTIITGIYKLGQDRGGLVEARKLLEPFRGVHRADMLLELIDELSKD